MADRWRISIDTGGTFTDCIALHPSGEILRVKVLSNSRLRGKLIEKTAPRTYRFSHQWRIEKDIFKRYSFALTQDFSGSQDFPGFINLESLNLKVESIDFQQNLLRLSHDLPTAAIRFPYQFEITANEEAPILAARLATSTPLDEPLPPLEMRLGTTKGTNALLEKKGAACILLITKGFGDLLAIGTQQRPHLFQLNIPEPELLCTQVIEVSERLDAQGEVIQPLTEKELKRLVLKVKKSGANSVAVALLHAWRNPVHELKIRDALQAAGIRFVSLSHALMPAIKILPRAQTALVDAYLTPVLHEYLENISASLHAGHSGNPLKIMSSAGGLVDAARFSPKDSLLSGPAGGVVGMAAIAQSLGFQKVIGFDMGGTSTDAARFDGHFDYEYLTHIGSIEMSSPCLAIETVAAGGGSVCWFDGHKLCIGPESAGATPGPACYGAGGPLAITDVNLLLGKLDPSVMGIPVSREPALAALHALQEDVFKKTGLRYDEEALLRGFEKIANEKMAGAIRKISVAKGFGTKEYALLAFGGAGGLHACNIAELLDIQRVILPYDAGLLSAYGIAQACVEQFAQRQVLKKLEDCEPELPRLAEALTAEAANALMAEGFLKNEMEVKNCLLYLRFQGQESSLEIRLPYPIPTEGSFNVEHFFEKKYRRLFGHYPGNRPVEVESMKVVVAGRHSGQSFSAKNEFAQSKMRNARQPATPSVVIWDDLAVGDALEGPVILLNATSTAYLEADWRLEVASGKNLILTRSLLNKNSTVSAHPFPDASPLSEIITNSKTHNPQPTTHNSQLKTHNDPIELELFTNRFTAIAEEMGAQLQRTAFSVNVKERLDFSCALLDTEAELLVNAPHIPVHLGSLGICARLVKEKIRLGPGDVVITNHPKYGGSHLPDVTLLSPVFAPSDIRHPDIRNRKIRNRLVGYVINRAHHAEIGGSRPGSMPPDARTLEEEGVVFAPMYLVKNGLVQWEAVEELLTGSPFPTRSLHENLADINAALASLRTGGEKLQNLVAEHGLEKVQGYMAKLKQTAAEALAEALQPFDNQIFTAKEKLDDGLEIAVTVRVKSGRICIDFTGTGSVHPRNLNANISIVYSAVIYVLRLLCGKAIPLNEGLMKNVKIVLPPGTFLHPDFEDNPAHCPAVVGGNTEVSQRLVDALLKAFSPIVKTACSQGTMNNFLFGNEHFGYYETIGGGAGAGDGFHGRSAVHQHMTNTKITDPEELERRYPVRLRRFSKRKNSGGKGRWRGGDGIIREVEFLEEVELTIISQHRKERPYGSEGGQPGKRGTQKIVKATGEIRPLRGIDHCKMEKGDRIVIETPGGGGWGDFERVRGCLEKIFKI